MIDRNEMSGVQSRFLAIPAMAFIIHALLMSCAGGSDGVSAVEIKRFDLAAPGYAVLDSTERAAFRDTFQSAADVVASIVSMGEVRHADDAFLSDYASDSKMLYYLPDVERRLGPLDSAEHVIGRAVSNSRTSLPELKWPGIYGAVITYSQSVVVADSVLLIGLNHYLGPDYEPYGYFEPYQRYGKQKRFLPYNVVEAVVSVQYPYRAPSDATALSRMVYEGALAETVLALTGSDDESAVTGYTADQTAWAYGNEAQAWNAMIEKNLIYSTDPAVSDRLVRPSPSTSILHPSSPGRMGRFMGMQIVKSYLDRHPGVSAASLLDSAVYNSPDFLIGSGYSPMPR